MKHRSSDEELVEFFQKVSEIEIPAKRSKLEVRERVASKIDNIEQLRSNQRWLKWTVGIAATTTLLMALFSVFYPQTGHITKAAASGEMIQEILPDGSEVMLNAGSSIRYSEDWDRKIALQGEAFFKVMKGEAFTVHANQGIVKVLGTSFNVCTREKRFEVACKSGKVEVAIPTKRYTQVIYPGEIVSFSSDTVRVLKIEKDLIDKWRIGEFYFRSVPTSEVFAEIQRQFEVKISLTASIEERAFTGYFNDENVETALNMICLPLGLGYKRTGRSRYLISRNME